MEKVLVAGANGTTGTQVVEKLKYNGHYDPIAMIRNADQKEKFDAMGVEVLVADLEDDLTDKLSGIDKIIFAAGSGGSTGPEKTVAVDEKGAMRLIDASLKNNIKKFVMLSSMGADNPSSNSSIKHYLEAKHNADEHLKKSNLNYCIVRPGRLTDEDGTGHIDASPKLNKAGSISRKDVAQVLVTALDHANISNKTIEILEGDKTQEEALAAL